MEKGSLQPVPSLAVIPMGRLGEMTVTVVAANLQGVLEIPVDVLEAVEVPEETFISHRQQYDAGLILEYLARVSPARYERVLALTSVDICIPILTHVFGEAQLGGRTALASGFRLRQDELGSPVPLDQYYERLAKVALHEVAHTLFLYHCEDPRCVMLFSSKVGNLDKVGLFFCSRCEFILRETLGGMAPKEP